MFESNVKNVYEIETRNKETKYKTNINELEKLYLKNKIVTAKPFNEPLKTTSIAKMVERFVESLSQINDSASFDTSLEVKNILHTPHKFARHRCVTELDRESLTRFVRDLEARQQQQQQQQRIQRSSSTKSTPKGSPYLCRKAIALYQNVFHSGGSSAHSSRSASPRLVKPTTNTPIDAQSMHSDLGSLDGQQLLEEDEQSLQQQQPERTEISTTAAASGNNSFQRSQSERSSYRSAVKVLQFLSGKQKCKSKQHNSTKSLTDDTVPSVKISPAPACALLGCQPLPNSSDTEVEEEAEADEWHDDGISSASSNFTQCSGGSRNCSPDTSFEMHAPLVPTFKVTPPQVHKCGSKNPAYEFARFLRSSFHAKRASVTKLRRSVSDPDALQQLNFDKVGSNNITNNSSKNDTGVQVASISAANRADVIRVSHF